MRAKGFTLVEVMVALAVVAIALPALLMYLYQQVDSTAYLRDKSMAYMVAANQLAALRIVSNANQSLTPGKDAGVEQMADRDWYWWLDKEPTAIAQFLRVEITVARTEELRDQALYTLVAFVSADLKSEPEVAVETESETKSDTETESETEPEADSAGI